MMPLNRSSGVTDALGLNGIRRGASNGDRSPSSLAGRPWTFVGSAGTCGAVWADAIPMRATLPASVLAVASRDRRVKTRSCLFTGGTSSSQDAKIYPPHNAHNLLSSDSRWRFPRGPAEAQLSDIRGRD